MVFLQTQISLLHTLNILKLKYVPSQLDEKIITFLFRRTEFKKTNKQDLGAHTT